MALVNNYRNELIKWPPGKTLRNTTIKFEDMKGFPGVVGAIDGTHIPIKAPIENPNDYINRSFPLCSVSKPNLSISIKNIVIKFYIKYN